MKMELGSVRVVTESQEEIVDVLKTLLRHLSNKEVGALLNISERTVRRWKLSGRLPSRGSDPILLADLLACLLRDVPANPLKTILPSGVVVESLLPELPTSPDSTETQPETASVVVTNQDAAA